MGLIKCPVCKKEVSERAPTCPNCGEPINRMAAKKQSGGIDLKDPVHLIGVIIAVLSIIGIIVYIASF